MDIKTKNQQYNNCSTYNLTRELVGCFGETELKLPGKQLKIIDELRLTPRSGKKCRIDDFNLHLPVQSLADHIYQVALLADFWLDAYNIEVDLNLLAETIASHDLAEVIIGDIPDYTCHSDDFKKFDGDLTCQEQKANTLIKHCLAPKLRDKFERGINNIEATTTESEIFWISDKIEPIIAIWRYLNFYHERIDFYNFSTAMTDFFDNPNVNKYALNQDCDRLITFLKDKKNAEHYFNTGQIRFINPVFTAGQIKNLVEAKEIEYV